MAKLRLAINMKGQTLVEVLVALGVAVVVITAITTAVLTSLNNSQYSKLQNQAAQYAQQGIEVMKSYRDAEALDEIETTGREQYRCLPEDCNPIIGEDFTNCFVQKATEELAKMECTEISSTNNAFTRYIRINLDGGADCGADTAQIASVVRWNDGKCNGDEKCHAVDVKTCMVDAIREGLEP